LGIHFGQFPEASDKIGFSGMTAVIPAWEIINLLNDIPELVAIRSRALSGHRECTKGSKRDELDRLGIASCQAIKLSRRAVIAQCAAVPRFLPRFAVGAVKEKGKSRPTIHRGRLLRLLTWKDYGAADYANEKSNGNDEHHPTNRIG
jgi:hypothetical protein